MAQPVPSSEPYAITAGDFWTWTKSLSDYPATSYTLTYALNKSDAHIDITASASGTDHLVEVAAATTADYDPGVYHWHSYATDGDGKRYKVLEGTIEVLTDFATQADGHDARTHAQKTLDALEAVILGKASKDQASYSIAGRSLSRMSPAELIEWRDRYRAEVVREKRDERRKRGHATGKIIKARF